MRLIYELRVVFHSITDKHLALVVLYALPWTV